MVFKLTAEQMVDNVNKFYEYIDKYISGQRKDQLKQFYKSIEQTLVDSPASTKESHHNCFPGGYLDHVLRVIELTIVIDRVWDKFGQSKNFTMEELVFSCINHDLGKLGTNEQPFYIPNDSDWHIKNHGAHYKINNKLSHMRIADRSLYYLQQAGISVTENEFLAIKLHDGLYEEGNKPYYVTFSEDVAIKSNLPYIIHQADLAASRIETQKK
jgi:hypothetical protein